MIRFAEARARPPAAGSSVTGGGGLPLAPLVPWTLRNCSTFHKFQPLAPRYANEANEFVPLGFNRWVKTWIADYASVEEIYWQVPALPIDAAQLPSRAFDSPATAQRNAASAGGLQHLLRITPALDARFAALAAQRIASSRLRYYVWLPALRIADMWLRPRTEILPSDTRWWEFNDDPKWSALAIFLMFVNLLFVPPRWRDAGAFASQNTSDCC